MITLKSTELAVSLGDADKSSLASNVQGLKDSNVEGRRARCQCGDIRPSSRSLGMFEYRGEGSEQARESCRNCRYYEVAHRLRDEGKIRNQYICETFIPHGAYEFDLFWCGCGGTD